MIWSIVGLIALGVYNYFTLTAVKYIDGGCLVLDETFDDLSNWEQQVRFGGFGNNEFDVTTSDAENSYVQDGQLIITPTLTSASGLDIFSDTLTLDNCNAPNMTADCSRTGNETARIAVPPVKSARLHSKASIQYGKVEVTAKLPSGDWLWPAIWMMPVDSVYGDWPASGSSSQPFLSPATSVLILDVR